MRCEYCGAETQMRPFLGHGCEYGPECPLCDFQAVMQTEGKPLESLSTINLCRHCLADFLEMTGNDQLVYPADGSPAVMHSTRLREVAKTRGA